MRSPSNTEVLNTIYTEVFEYNLFDCIHFRKQDSDDPSPMSYGTRKRKERETTIQNDGFNLCLSNDSLFIRPGRERVCGDSGHGR